MRPRGTFSNAAPGVYLKVRQSRGGVKFGREICAFSRECIPRPGRYQVENAEGGLVSSCHLRW